MTYVTWKYSGFNQSKVIGSGTSLDTARLRYLIGSKFEISPKNVHGYVMGEHGDSEFVPWSNLTIGQNNIENFLNSEEKEQIENEVRNTAYKIIEKKGATYYGIGMCLVRITNAILGDENTIITVSSYDKENDIFIGNPSVLNKDGVKSMIKVSLNAEEIEKYNNSVKVIKEALKKIF